MAYSVFREKCFTCQRLQSTFDKDRRLFVDFSKKNYKYKKLMPNIISCTKENLNLYKIFFSTRYDFKVKSSSFVHR